MSDGILQRWADLRIFVCQWLAECAEASIDVYFDCEKLLSIGRPSTAKDGTNFSHVTSLMRAENVDKGVDEAKHKISCSFFICHSIRVYMQWHFVHWSHTYWK